MMRRSEKLLVLFTCTWAYGMAERKRGCPFATLSLALTYLNDQQVLTEVLLYHCYSCDERVLAALSKGGTPRCPSQAQVTDCRWAFIRRCRTSVDAGQLCPSNEKIDDFTRDELVQLMLSQHTAVFCVIEVVRNMPTLV
ncbi:hypothetical protein BS17DRAFT_382287 [Gyrodon lividus]|nr:hypothetical protein BS17DRAFT_382287 [Gyrodon lividus]